MWSVEPKKSVGTIRLGARPSECHSFPTGPSQSFRRTPDSPETLAFDGDLLHVELDSSGRISAVTVFRPRELFLVGIQLLGLDTDSVTEALLAAGIAVSRVDAGLWNEELGIVLIEVDGIIDGVEVRR